MQTGGKFLVGSYRGKAASGCCDPRKAGEFGAENNRVRHRFPGVRHRLAEAGEAAFLSCSMMGDTATGKGPFHARATPQNPARKKEFPLRNADHKKALPPGRKKPAFPAGLYSWRSWTLRGKSFVYARKLPQKSAQKKEWQASWFVYHATVYEKNNRIPRGHFVAIVRGESVRNWTHKKGGERFHAPRFPQFHDRFSRRLFFTQSDR